MRLYPAIDLFEGKVVRLLQGDYQKQTVYSNTPEETASNWEGQGAEWIHVVDLEGAKTGVIKNRDALEKIRKKVKCNIQFGGGIRTLDDAQAILTAGIDRVVIGTKSLDRTFLEKILQRFGNKIAVGLDTQAGTVRMQGWAQDSGLSLEDALRLLNEFSAGTVIYTDIQKDGMLAGPNWSGVKSVLNLTPARVILSGGISSLKDIEKACEIKGPNFEGVILGKALYEQKFSLKDALERIRQIQGAA